ncbi:MAG: hypothetical protein WD751_02675 [Anaerolineales bacterium]
MKPIRWLPAGLALLAAALACNTITSLFAEGTAAPPDSKTPAPSTGPSIPSFDQQPVSDETLRILAEIIVPEKDAVDLADRLLNIEGVPDTLPAPDESYQLGARRSFWITNHDTLISSQTEGILRYVGDELYFWVEDGVAYSQRDLDDLARAFEDHIVPTNREFFGNEWIPGVDNDPHIYILYTTGLGSTVAGYFSSSDEIHPDADDHSNGAELFVFNADNTPLNTEFTYAVLAHEFQHMIHWYQDANETSWINEGLSELAMILNGYSEGADTIYYTIDPDRQLNDWPADGDTGPHYAAGLLFFGYFLERFGEEATQAVVVHPANGLESIDAVLGELDIHDPQTNDPLTADDLVLDWVIANYLNDNTVADGRYAYNTYPDLIQFGVPDTEFVNDCSQDLSEREVRQYGVDYIRIACNGQATLRFIGSTGTALLPASAYSGDYSFWSNKGDESDITLTRAFDFSDVSAPITLNYQTWFDIEEDWDYVYVLASVNGGDDWDFLATPSGTDTDPIGNNYGYGYTGASGDWISESVDLSDYAGQEVLIRFEYITDPAVNGEGLLVDDISIPQIGYFEDFEQDDGGWIAAGFARVKNVLPQTFHLALISFGDETRVQILGVPENNVLDIPLDFTGGVDEVTLVVVGSMRFTRQPASYAFTFAE